jgi:formylglycine-generating enzyme required for sulfatase activity/murein DD-endopeptidase MepM/ murein hydrolase activator NlpD
LYYYTPYLYHSQYDLRNKNILVDDIEQNDEIVFFAYVNYPSWSSVEIKFDELRNISFGTQPANLSKTVQSNLTRYIFNFSKPGAYKLFSLKSSNQYKSWSYQYRYFHATGYSLSKAVDNYAYGIPYDSKNKFEVSQGYLAQHSHHNTYALDWDMPESTPIYAARSGKVTFVEQSFSEAGWSEYYLDKANFIEIQHSDATIATYVHLMKNGAIVEPGETVSKGDLLGYSGNTGYSTGPHLHFEVEKQTYPSDRKSIKTKFKRINSDVVYMNEGDTFFGSANAIRIHVESRQGGEVNLTGEVLSADPIELIAVSEDGYIFEKWDGLSSSLGKHIRISKSIDETISPIFSPDLGDEDGDGLTSFDEYQQYGSSDLSIDTDQDGLSDMYEIQNGFNPTVSDTSAIRIEKRKAFDNSNHKPFLVDWYYLPQRGWQYTDKYVYPYVYDSATNDWLYFQTGSTNPRFFSYASNKWFFLRPNLWTNNHKVDAIGMRMNWCLPGRFQMGSPVNEINRDDDEFLHNVAISNGFYLGVHEVSQIEWKLVMGSNPSRYKGDSLPVENVSWTEALDFCSKLTLIEQSTGKIAQDWEYDLPTESEWEYACRAGTNTPYSWGQTISKHEANFGIPGPTLSDSARTEKTDNYSPNAWGFYNMHGNVSEWTLDWYGKYRNAKLVIDPTGSTIGDQKVHRGGNYYDEVPSQFFGTTSTDGNLRSGNRAKIKPEQKSSWLGFRIAFRQKSKPPQSYELKVKDYVTVEKGFLGDDKISLVNGWVFSQGSGWLWTTNDVYPFIFSNKFDSWVYFEGQKEELRFYLYSYKRWLNNLSLTASDLEIMEIIDILQKASEWDPIP